MPRAWSPCSHPSCPTLTPPGQPRCGDHRYDRTRPTARARGYDHTHEIQFRAEVLAREPYCRLCYAPATVADHHPLSRRELVARGLNPNNPARGRGLCVRCHNRETSKREGGAKNFRVPGGTPP